MLVITLILASILFPVFLAAKGKAKQTVCSSNIRQAALAKSLYVEDYDDRFMPANYTVAGSVSSLTDRTWVQVLLPYTKSFRLFRCPGDYGTRPTDDSTFDEDLVLGDAYSRYYHASERSNIGYNYTCLSAMVFRQATGWQAKTRAESEIAYPVKTILFLDSVYNLSRDGQPDGGGSYLVMPPCRYQYRGTRRVDTWDVDENGETVYRAHEAGWMVNGNGARSYGGAFPWHSGRMNVAMVSGNVRSFSPEELIKGCSADINWNGLILDDSSYLWDER